jgi:hemolysin activation/secretion protein
MRYVFACLFFAGLLFADEDVYPPKPRCKDEDKKYCCEYPEDACLLPQKPTVLVPCAKGLIVVESDEGLDPNEVSGVVFSGIDIPGNREYLRDRLACLVVDQEITTATIEEIKKQIHLHFYEEGYPFVRVFLPEQEVTNHVLKMVVVESRLGKVEARENRWYKSSLLEKSISVEPDEILNLNQIMRDLNYLNKSPFMRVDAIYTPGAEPYTTDIILKVKDICPLRVYGGVDNAGLVSTNRGRGYAGIEYGNMWGRNHTLNLGAISSLDSSRFRAYTAQYIALLSAHHVLTLYGGYSHVHNVQLEFPSMKNHGNSYQGSLRYAIPLRPMGRLNQEVSFGADFKRTNNTVEFSALFERFGKNANLTQFMLGYDANFEVPLFRIDWGAELFCSPGRIVADQTNADYSSLRPGAVNRYIYGTGHIRFVQWMPRDFSFVVWLRGQVASNNLLPSEQIGLGGFDTVRGYEERQLNTDAGFILNTEIRTPFIRLHPKSWGRKKYSEGIQFLVFMDYGYGRNHTPIPNEGKKEFLLGAGPGARYNIDPWIYARLDWGFKWHSEPEFGFGGSMLHFAVNISL